MSNKDAEECEKCKTLQQMLRVGQRHVKELQALIDELLEINTLTRIEDSKKCQAIIARNLSRGQSKSLGNATETDPKQPVS